ncbi:sugar ABC transporter substrate-binding protein [uncultured Jatrophihabitans sp.]|uniref:sugar ABC transporter substrate-binding protein n=1 Tax=uncultured Jatrophihabitans sp. TaxID=1610747 RepID=UPI0035CBCF80
MRRFIKPSDRARIGAISLAVGAAVTLAACGSSGSGSSSSGGGGSSSSSSGATGVAYAKSQVAKYSPLRTTFPEPGVALTGVTDKLAGKTVWYIPIFLQAPIFTAEATALTAALKTAGVNVHVCDAATNPSTADTCLKQAVSSHAAGIVTAALDYSFASQAYGAAIAAKIPIVATDNDKPGSFPNNPDIRRLTIGGPVYAALGADWIIADSGGKAQVLYVADNSNAGVTQTAAVKGEFAKQCPDCKLTVVSFSDPTIDKLPTAVSSAMTANPKINYVFGGYDAPSGIFALQGAKQVTGRKFTYLTVTGQPPGLQRVASGQQAADPGVDTAETMWNATDALLRIITGQQQVNYLPALRLFDKANVPSNTKSAAAYASGSWYSNGGFRAMYTKLWGLG